ncbi:MAG: hypothetical protein ACFFDT_36470 [Candidatus Hodarchaeota archaeon]
MDENDYEKRLEATKDLFRQFAEVKGMEIEEDVKVEGQSGRKHAFPFFLPEKSINRGTGIIIKPWTRKCGSNVVIQAENIANDVKEVGRVVVLATEFSDAARKTARNSETVLTLSSGELCSFLYSEGHVPKRIVQIK